MSKYLGLGSNMGDRREHLRRALAELSAQSVTIQRVSPVVESPAMLAPNAPPDWNLPFLNLVAECETDLSPPELLAVIKEIETRLGRNASERWSPRPIDIDILLFDGLRFSANELVIPHPGIASRPFVFTPLAALRPGLKLTEPDQFIRQHAVQSGQQIPLWMGIVNLTPDSFSDGGSNDNWKSVEALINEMVEHGAQLLDFGAESTRPGATPLSADQEWSRLEPILGAVVDKYSGDWLAPRISVDTYHADVARRALALGANIINDVSGLTQPAMIELAASTDADFIAMHNLGLPADPKATLATDRSACDQVEDWLDDRLAAWQAAGLDLNRVVFDPGVGFGKNPVQSLELMRNIDRFTDRDVRVLVGHSRKSFMNSFSSKANSERDLLTIGASLSLARRGVDILRVHNVPGHVTAWRGWAHAQGD